MFCSFGCLFLNFKTGTFCVIQNYISHSCDQTLVTLGIRFPGRISFCPYSIQVFS